MGSRVRTTFKGPGHRSDLPMPSRSGGVAEVGVACVRGTEDVADAFPVVVADGDGGTDGS